LPRAPLAPPSNVRVLAAELVGTAVLMAGGPGTAVLAGDRVHELGVALAFGISLLAMAYVLGHVSGCHINPAVTLAMVLARKVPVSSAPFYVVGQLVGAALGGGVIFGIASGLDEYSSSGHFAQNGWGAHSPGGYGLGSTIIVEVMFTALLVFVVLSTTHGRFLPAVGGITVGLTLTLIHLVTIPVDNTSVNPARSFGAALFAGADAWKQLWAFVVFPLVGSFVGLLLWLFVHEDRLEDTMLDTSALRAARDRAEAFVDRAADLVEDAVDDVAERRDPPA
jgi:aquaporin Z